MRQRLSVIGNLRDEDGVGSLPDFSHSKKTALKAHSTSVTAYSSRKSSSMGCSVLVTLPSTEELLAAASHELYNAERDGANARGELSGGALAPIHLFGCVPIPGLAVAAC